MESLLTQLRSSGVPGIAKNANLRLENADKQGNAAVIHFLLKTSHDEVSSIFAHCVPVCPLPTALCFVCWYNEAHTDSSTYLNTIPTDALDVRGVNRLPHVKSRRKRSRCKCSTYVRGLSPATPVGCRVRSRWHDSFDPRQTIKIVMIRQRHASPQAQAAKERGRPPQ